MVTGDLIGIVLHVLLFILMIILGCAEGFSLVRISLCLYAVLGALIFILKSLSFFDELIDPI